MFWIKPPAIFEQVFRDAWWRMPENEQAIYITFDDGPHPDTTPFILDQLRQHDMKATFFCLGRSVEAYPNLYQQILSDGHQVGLHCYDHISGWKVDTATYLDDIQKAAGIIQTNLFRPPYGRLSWSQWKTLKNKYQIVMWTTLPEDFRNDISHEDMLRRLTNHVRRGDIVVLHENDKSHQNIRHILPSYLTWLSDQDFTSKQLPDAG